MWVLFLVLGHGWLLYFYSCHHKFNIKWLTSLKFLEIYSIENIPNFILVGFLEAPILVVFDGRF